ncbi:MAG TPA: hypothetical protein VFO51_07150 [Sphingomicrobium sp.]|nr:hypothetical protein [Sphingomicrobium sp.]
MFNHVAAVIQYMKDKRRRRDRPNAGKDGDERGRTGEAKGSSSPKDGRGDG